MSLLINLLPDIRQAKLREVRRRQMVTGVSLSIWVICGAVVGLLALYELGLKAVIVQKTDSITQKKADLEAVPGLIDAMTADQHLASLPGLYDKRVYLSKFYAVYTEIDPASIIVNSLAVDSKNILTVRGTAPTYAEVAKLARALAKSNTELGTGAKKENVPYFTNINITSVDSAQKGNVSFSLTAVLGTGVVSVSNQ